MSNPSAQKMCVALIPIALTLCLTPFVYRLAAGTTSILLTRFQLTQWNPANWIGMFVGLLAAAGLIRGGIAMATVISAFQKKQTRPAMAPLAVLMIPLVLATTAGIITFVGSMLIPQITLQLAFLFSMLMAGMVAMVAIEARNTWWNHVVRGARLRQITQSRRVPGQIPWGGLSIKRENQPLHYAMLGNTGTGKTTWLEVFMTVVLPEVGIVSDTRGIIFDAKRDLIPFLAVLEIPYKILNPLDERAAAWDIGKDIRGEGMAREFAALIVEDLENGKQ
jgi:hypothetical protein